MFQLLDVAIGFATVMLAVSLIVMSLTQAAASMLALRGANLRRGLEELIKHTVPGVAANASAARVSLKQLTEAIVQHPLISDSATRRQGRWSWASAIKVEELLPVLDAVLASKKMAALTTEQRTAIAAWFDSFMARVAQWFVMNTRWITVGLSAAIVLVTHLDTAQVIRQLQQDQDTRTRVAAMAASLLDHSPQALDKVEAIYTETLKELVRSQGAKFSSPVAQVPTIARRADAAAWITAHAAAQEAPALVAEYDKALDATLSESIDKSIDRAKTLQAGVSAAGISLIPSSSHTWRCYRPTSQHFFGMLASILFLSLGAPFWFNSLKNLSSLRSVVATKAGPAADGSTTGAAARVAPGAEAPSLPPVAPAQPAARPPRR